MAKKGKMLKSCPFCGENDPYVFVRGGKNGRFTYVQCGLCGAQTKTYKYRGDEHSSEIDFLDTSVNQAIDAWNRRA